MPQLLSAELPDTDGTGDLKAESGESYQLYALCEQCKAVFSRSPLVKNLTGKDERYTWHLTFASLKRSVAASCHFCTLTVSELREKQGKHDFDAMEGSFGAVFLAMSELSGLTQSASLRQQGFRVDSLFAINVSFEAAVKNEANSFVAVSLLARNTSSVYDHPTAIWPALSKGNTDSAEHVALARLWISHCQRIHRDSSCNWRSNFVPTRLLRLNGVGKSLSVNLHVTTSSDKALSYCCLSHCWGENKTLLLNKLNSTELEEGIAVADIPKTYLDAIQITQSLDIDYLWIDSLCIFQDCAEDWKKEAAVMAKVYSNSYCTIAAAGAEDCHQGCYTTRNPLTFAPCRIAGTEKDGLFAHRNHEHIGSIEDLEQTSTLFTRAWAFQERMLSPRTLYFGENGIAFSCRCIFASETDVDSTVWPLQPRKRYDDALWHSPQTSLEWIRHNEFIDSAELHEIWVQIVSEYSALKMTKPEDKLIAISGVAQQIANATYTKYLAGLWRSCFILEMLWFVGGRPQPRPATFRAPSWSWASIDGRIANKDSGKFFSNVQCKPMASFVHANFSTYPGDKSGTGGISGSYLQMKGLIKLAPPIQSTDTKMYSEIEKISFDENLFGEVYIDAANEMRQVPYLMPLSRTVDKKHKEERGTCNCAIKGLFLHMVDVGYQRVGLFSVSGRDGTGSEVFHNIASKYFDDCVEQDIIFVDGDKK